jgi:hypothetical protein
MAACQVTPEVWKTLMAEAMAEHPNKSIRAELGFAAEEARDIEALLQQGYRGSRYSFGYPACPISPTSARCSRCSTPRRSASRSPTRTSSTPSSRPRPSS